MRALIIQRSIARAWSTGFQFKRDKVTLCKALYLLQSIDSYDLFRKTAFCCVVLGNNVHVSFVALGKVGNVTHGLTKWLLSNRQRLTFWISQSLTFSVRQLHTIDRHVNYMKHHFSCCQLNTPTHIGMSKKKRSTQPFKGNTI